MDLNALKSKLNTLQNSGQSDKKKIDYKAIYWKPQVGEAQVRVVPSLFDKTSPFKELYIHYNVGNKTMLSPINFGETDPIVEFAKQLRSTGDYENYKLAKELDPRMRVFIPVIVRGEEEKGVRLWQVGKLMYENFLTYAMDDEVGDFTDVSNGLDFKVVTVGPESTGKKWNESKLYAKRTNTPLGTDEQTQQWLSTQPNPEELFKKYTFEELKTTLTEWLNPEEVEGAVSSETPAPFENSNSNVNLSDKTENNYSLNTNATKKSKLDQFDDLF